MYVMAENTYKVRNVATIWFIFHDFPVPRLNSATFQGWKILNSMTFHDFPGSVHTLAIVNVCQITNALLPIRLT